MHLVVGLGNPGRSYERTRHNVGFLVVDRLAERWGANPRARQQFGALLGDGTVAQQRVVFLQPQGFMNTSGQPVATAAGFFRIQAPQVIVVHDDMDLPFGAVRCKKGGGHGGHNGLRDISRAIGAEYVRVRFGVGRPPAGWDPANYVLGKWSADEERGLPALLDLAAEALEAILVEGVDAASNRFNGRA